MLPCSQVLKLGTCMSATRKIACNTEDCAEKITSKVARWHMIDYILAYDYDRGYTRSELNAEDTEAIVKIYLKVN